jgi:hypothetical protein
LSVKQYKSLCLESSKYTLSVLKTTGTSTFSDEENQIVAGILGVINKSIGDQSAAMAAVEENSNFFLYDSIPHCVRPEEYADIRKRQEKFIFVANSPFLPEDIRKIARVKAAKCSILLQQTEGR